MYEYGNARYGCGCGGSGDYQADGDALARLARAAEREDCGAEQERRAGSGAGHQVHQDCGAGSGGAGQRCGRCSICGLVNCVRRTICGCGCGCRRGRGCNR